MSSTSIAAAAQAAVTMRPNPKARRGKPQLPGQPVIDEAAVAAGIVDDAKATAATTDANTVPGPLPAQRIVLLVAGLSAGLGTMAMAVLAQTRTDLAQITAAARGLYRAQHPAVRIGLWICLVTLETVAVQKVLAEVLGINQDLPRWVAAGFLAGITTIAGTALANSWHGSRRPSTDDEDGMIGRDLLRAAGALTAGAVLMFATGLIWVRVTSADIQTAGLLDPVPDMTWPHAVFIAGIVALSFTVSFAAKLTELALESRTAVRLTTRTQRLRVQALEMIHAANAALGSYIVAEGRGRELAQGAPLVWQDAFLSALHPDTRDRWVLYLAEHPNTQTEALLEAAWVATLREEIAEWQVLAHTLGLPAQDGAADQVVTPAGIGLRNPAMHPASP